MTFLGHVISEHGVDTDPGKISALTQRAQPNCVEDVRSFLGLAGYYREHVRNYADMAAPLHALTKKGVDWQWDSEEEEAYRGLVAALTSDTLLAHPRLDDGGWIVDTDASGRALGAVLTQEQDGREMVIRYASKCLTPEQWRYCTTKRELLGATWALKAFRHYLPVPYKQLPAQNQLSPAPKVVGPAV